MKTVYAQHCCYLHPICSFSTFIAGKCSSYNTKTNLETFWQVPSYGDCPETHEFPGNWEVEKRGSVDYRAQLGATSLQGCCFWSKKRETELGEKILLLRDFFPLWLKGHASASYKNVLNHASFSKNQNQMLLRKLVFILSITLANKENSNVMGRSDLKFSVVW